MNNRRKQQTEKTSKAATHRELKKTEKLLRSEILKVEERVENVEERLERVEDKVDIIDVKLDKIGVTLDKFVGRIANLDADNAAGTLQMRRLTVATDNHEKRITALEIH